jgi:hypothetical protein
MTRPALLLCITLVCALISGAIYRSVLQPRPVARWTDYWIPDGLPTPTPIHATDTTPETRWLPYDPLTTPTIEIGAALELPQIERGKE